MKATKYCSSCRNREDVRIKTIVNIEDIKMEELEKSIKTVKSEKSPGYDGIAAKNFKCPWGKGICISNLQERRQNAVWQL